MKSCIVISYDRHTSPNLTYGSSSHVDKSIIVILVVSSIVAQVYMVHPDIGRIFDRNCIFVCRSHVLMHCVTDDDVCHIQNGEANTNDLSTSSEDIPSNCDKRNLLPLRPMIDLLDPTKTFLAPEMVPEMITIRGSFPVTAL